MSLLHFELWMVEKSYWMVRSAILLWSQKCDAPSVRTGLLNLLFNYWSLWAVIRRRRAAGPAASDFKYKLFVIDLAYACHFSQGNSCGLTDNEWWITLPHEYWLWIMTRISTTENVIDVTSFLSCQKNGNISLSLHDKNKTELWWPPPSGMSE